MENTKIVKITKCSKVSPQWHTSTLHCFSHLQINNSTNSYHHKYRVLTGMHLLRITISENRLDLFGSAGQLSWVQIWILRSTFLLL